MFALSKSFFLRDVLGLGAALWLFGYVLGFAAYAFAPIALIGWYVMPFGIAATAFVLWKWAHIGSMVDALWLGVGWCAIAIVCDAVFILKLLNPPDGYYKLDVYLYYALTLALPIGAGWHHFGSIAAPKLPPADAI